MRRSITKWLCLLSFALLPLSHSMAGHDSSGQACKAVFSVRKESRPRHPLYHLRERYIGEEKGKRIGNTFFRTRYMYDSADRDVFRVHVVDGKVLDFRNRPLQSNGYHHIFVVSPQGELFISAIYSPGFLHHSTFLAGGPVIAAGTMVFRDGKLFRIDNDSGHYFPSISSIHVALERLLSLGVDISEVVIEPVIHSAADAPHSSEY